MKNNFKCTSCDNEAFISRHKTFFEAGGIVYKHPNGSQIVCDKCGAEMVSVSKGNGFCANIGKYSSMNMVDKKKVIAKRAADHTKKNMDEIREKG